MAGRVRLRPALRHYAHSVAPVAAPEAAPWWLAGGINPASCVAAYQAKGAASQAASYVNLANPGTYDAVPGTAPTWAAETGWTFDGSTQYLTTGITPANTWSVLVRFSNYSAGDRYVFGVYQVSGTRIWSIVAGNAGNHNYIDGNFPGRVVAGVITSGVMGMAGGEGFLNGVSEGTQAPGVVPALALYIGGFNKGGAASNYFVGKIQAFSIYNASLSGAQMAAVSAAMAAL